MVLAKFLLNLHRNKLWNHSTLSLFLYENIFLQLLFIARIPVSSSTSLLRAKPFLRRFSILYSMFFLLVIVMADCKLISMLLLLLLSFMFFCQCCFCYFWFVLKVVTAVITCCWPTTYNAFNVVIAVLLALLLLLLLSKI